mgnify:CR=1 FL=1
MPLVLCLALGTSFGGHNGSSILSRALQEYAGRIHRCVVIGGGNEAAQRHHYYGRFQEAGEIREAELRVEEGVGEFAAELWTTLPISSLPIWYRPPGRKARRSRCGRGAGISLSFPSTAPGRRWNIVSLLKMTALS